MFYLYIVNQLAKAQPREKEKGRAQAKVKAKISANQKKTNLALEEKRVVLRRTT